MIEKVTVPTEVKVAPDSASSFDIQIRLKKVGRGGLDIAAKGSKKLKVTNVVD